jgi:membrane protein required for beta-lactamase induction
MSKGTGLSIEVAKSASLDSLEEEVRVDLGATATAINKYDGYCIKTTWVHELAQHGVLEELTEYIKHEEALFWTGKREFFIISFDMILV